MNQNDFAVMNTADMYKEMMDKIEAMQPEIPMRDWFAGLAMQGFLTSGAYTGIYKADHTLLIPVLSYMIADAMMKERDK